MKTDLVAWIAARFERMAVLVHPTGDEDRMLRGRFPGRVFAHRDLLEAWRRARASGFACAVCDGGLQDPALEDCPAVRLVHPEEPVGLDRILPFGRFRGAVCRRGGRELRLGLGTQVRRTASPDDPEASRVRVACAVARPEAFVQDLLARGWEVEEVVALPDHGRFPRSLLRRIALDPRGWAVTPKDAHRHRLPDGVRVVAGRLSPDPQAEEALLAIAAWTAGLADQAARIVLESSPGTSRANLGTR